MTFATWGDRLAYLRSLDGKLAEELCVTAPQWAGAPPERCNDIWQLCAEKGISDQQQKEIRRAADAAQKVKTNRAKSTNVPDLSTSPQPQEKRTNIRGGAHLLSTEFEPLKFIIPDILPVGKADLAGRPKLGKSWLALLFAVAVSVGGMVFGRKVDRAKVLYLALEDSDRRLKDRILKMGAVVDDEFFHYDTSWPPLAQGGIIELKDAIEAHDYKFIVIDTISRALGNADQMDAGEMNVIMGALQHYASEKQICILLVDHHRKSASNGSGEGDPVDDVLGATSKAGVSDVVMGLYRQRGQRGATLKIVGRDIDDQDLAIDFDKNTGCWQLLGDSSDVKAGSVQDDILSAMTESGGTSTCAKIAKMLDRKYPNVLVELRELVAKGKIEPLEASGKERPYRVLG